MAEELLFNKKTFLMVREEKGWSELYRYYVDNNPDSILEFNSGELFVNISTSIFPNQQYGYGIESNIITSEVTHSLNSKPYRSNFEAAYAAFKYIYSKNIMNPRYKRDWSIIKSKLQQHFSPTNFFDSILIN